MTLKTLLEELKPYQTAAVMLPAPYMSTKGNIYRALEGHYICVFWSIDAEFETEIYKAETVDDMLNNVGEWKEYNWILINIWK